MEWCAGSSSALGSCQDDQRDASPIEARPHGTVGALAPPKTSLLSGPGYAWQAETMGSEDEPSQVLLTDVASFTSTHGAGEDELRVLLERGDAQQRVWAGWRLALRIGDHGRQSIHAGFEQAPDVGTQRNLLVVLAGLGERSILRAVAEHESTAVLRGEAAVLFWRTAQEPEQALQFVRDRLTQETDPDVLKRMITVSPSLPVAPVSEALWLLATKCSAVEVRRAAWLKLLENRALSGPQWRRIVDEDDDDLRVGLLERCAASSMHRVLLETARTTPRCDELLGVLAEAGRTYPWADLRELALSQNRPGPVLGLLAGAIPTEGRLWLFGLLDLEAQEYEHERWQGRPWSLALQAYAALDSDQLEPREVAAADRLERKVREFDAQVDPEGPDFCRDWDPMCFERSFLTLVGREPGALSRYSEWDE